MVLRSTFGIWRPIGAQLAEGVDVAPLRGAIHGAACNTEVTHLHEALTPAYTRPTANAASPPVWFTVEVYGLIPHA